MENLGMPLGKVYDHYKCIGCNQISRYRCEKCGKQLCPQHAFHVEDASEGYPITLCQKCLQKRNKRRIILHTSFVAVIAFTVLLLIIA